MTVDWNWNLHGNVNFLDNLNRNVLHYFNWNFDVLNNRIGLRYWNVVGHWYWNMVGYWNRLWNRNDRWNYIVIVVIIVVIIVAFSTTFVSSEETSVGECR